MHLLVYTERKGSPALLGVEIGGMMSEDGMSSKRGCRSDVTVLLGHKITTLNTPYESPTRAPIPP